MGPSVARKENGTGILPSTSDGNFSRGYPCVSRAIAYDEDAISKFSCRVATRATISISILVTFFLRFFDLSRHLREQKIARVAAELTAIVIQRFTIGSIIQTIEGKLNLILGFVKATSSQKCFVNTKPSFGEATT